MKTYQQYKQIIQKREEKEYDKRHRDHNHDNMLCIDSSTRTVFDDTAEIMNMQFEDFLKELKLDFLALNKESKPNKRKG